MKILTLITLCNAELRSFFFKLVFFFRWSLVAIVRSLFGYHYSQGPRTQGGRGARAPLKIGDLYSKFFGKRQNLIFLFIRAPNRSSAPDYSTVVIISTSSICPFRKTLLFNYNLFLFHHHNWRQIVQYLVAAHMSLRGSKVLIILVLMMNWEYGSMKSKYNLMGFIFCANKNH